MTTARAVALVTLLCVAACDPSDVPGALDAGAATDTLPGASPDTGTGRGGSAVGTGGAISGTGGALGTGGAMAGTGGAIASPGTGGTTGEPTAPYCAQNAVVTHRCGVLLRPGVWDGKWKDGMRCVQCTRNGQSLTGCHTDNGSAAVGGGEELCVSSCTECCYKTPGRTCESDADCCAPLRCKDGAPGQNKACG